MNIQINSNGDLVINGDIAAYAATEGFETDGERQLRYEAVVGRLAMENAGLVSSADPVS